MMIGAARGRGGSALTRAFFAAGAFAATTAVWGAGATHADATATATADTAADTAADDSDPPPGVRAPVPAGDPQPAHADTLRLVQVVFRHGARTPLSSRTHLYEHVDWTGCCAPDAMPSDRVRLDLRPVAPAAASATVPTTAEGDAAGSSSSSPATDADAKQRATILRGGCHKGELTLLGKAQAERLGAWLRARYARGGEEGAQSFLPPQYHPSLVAARTTNYARTRGTLRGVLAGLWPDLASPGAPAVPAVTASDLDEILFADSRACPHLAALLEASADLLESKKARERERVERAQAALTERLALPEGYWDRRWAVTDVHDVATSLPAHGRPLAARDGGGAGGGGGEGSAAAPGGGRLPTWLEDEVNRLATAEFSHFVAPSLRDAHGGTVLRLSMGRLLDSLLARMDEAVAAAAAAAAAPAEAPPPSSSPSSSPSSREQQQQHPRPYPPLRLYAGHDSTVLPLLVAIGGRDVVRWPPYCSNLVLELHEVAADGAGAAKGAAAGAPSSSPSSSQWFVRVLFNGEPLPVGSAAGGGGGGEDPHGAVAAAPAAAAAAADPRVGAHAVPLETFRREVLAPFLLSDEDHRLACTRPLTHDDSLPQPQQQEAAAAAGKNK